MPSPPSIEGANFERWKESGEPEAWVLKHRRGWNHKTWLGLLAALRGSLYWPMREDEIGRHLELLRANQFRSLRAVVEEAGKDCKYSVKLLLAFGNDVNETSYRQRAPLYLAVERGDREIVELLLAAGADVNAEAPSPARFALVEAAEKGRADLVRLLLAVNAKVNVRDCLEETPLYKAVKRGDREIVELLLAAGADVNVEARYGARFALVEAAEKGRADLVRLLLPANARVDIGDHVG